MGISVVLRNDKGDLMSAYTNFMNGRENPLTAEATSLNRATNIAMHCCFVKSHFETDNEASHKC